MQILDTKFQISYFFLILRTFRFVRKNLPTSLIDNPPTPVCLLKNKNKNAHPLMLTVMDPPRAVPSQTTRKVNSVTDFKDGLKSLSQTNSTRSWVRTWNVKIDFDFWFLVWYTTTQLATQLHQRFSDHFFGSGTKCLFHLLVFGFWFVMPPHS